MSKNLNKQKEQAEIDVARAALGAEVAKAFDKYFKDSHGESQEWVDKVKKGIESEGKDLGKTDPEIANDISQFDKGRIAGKPTENYQISDEDLAEVLQFDETNKRKRDHIRNENNVRHMEDLDGVKFSNTFIQILKHDTDFYTMLSDESFKSKVLKDHGVSSSSVDNGSPEALQNILEPKEEFTLGNVMKYYSKYGFHPAMIEESSETYNSVYYPDKEKDTSWSFKREIEASRNNDEEGFRKVMENLAQAEMQDSNPEHGKSKNGNDVSQEEPDGTEGERSGKSGKYDVNGSNGYNPKGKADLDAKGQKPVTIVDPTYSLYNKITGALRKRRDGKEFFETLDSAESEIGKRVGRLDDPMYKNNELFNEQVSDIANIAQSIGGSLKNMKMDAKNVGKISELSSHMKHLGSTIKERLSDDDAKPDGEKMKQKEREELEKMQAFIKDMLEKLRMIMSMFYGKKGSESAPTM